jgi:alkylation response protein AidB-like acyl-CoA dehydrogenase
MSEYRPPIRDIEFTLNDIIDFDGLRATGAFPNADPDIVSGALDEVGRFVAEVITPLARVGDTQGSVRNPDGSVTTPEGYKAAYDQFAGAGWPAVAFPESAGGGGLPFVFGLALSEMVAAADLAFSLCPMLTYAANELLLEHGTPEQQDTFLENLVTGRWAGTMLLTEPQAGSDVGALTAKAIPGEDGTYRISGTKIFVTWGEQDLTENIIHITLARTPDSPPGTKGISCFIIPKYLVNEDGSLGEHNDLSCVSLEEKVGIHASPTAVLSFGDEDGAVGYMVGEEHQGMRYMFLMMNNARLHVGVQGLAVAERAYQQALAYSLERKQGRAPGAPKGESSPIAGHPDVRRMLLLMKSQIEAMRGVMYKNGEAIDMAEHHPDADVRAMAAEIAAILTPVSKAWGSDLGVEITSLGMQVHGGVGYIEETGAPQWWRDSRIAPIYEGTNGIQAQDLAMRKLPLRDGQAVADLLAEMRGIADCLDGDLAPIGERLGDAVDILEEASHHLLGRLAQNPLDSLAGATPYCELFGVVAGGWVHGLAALAARRRLAEGADPHLEQRLVTARFYAENVLTRAAGYLGTIMAGAEILYGFDPES